LDLTGRSWWLKIWTGSYEEAGVRSIFMSAYQTSFATAKSPTIDDDLKYYLTIYVVISIATSILGTLKFFFIFWGSLKASRNLFESLTFTVLRAPLRWVDTVPLGRILNRFTADFNVIDSRLSMDVSFAASSFLQLIGVMIAGFVYLVSLTVLFLVAVLYNSLVYYCFLLTRNRLFVSPYIILLALVLAVFCLRMAVTYLTGAREVKRLEVRFVIGRILSLPADCFSSSLTSSPRYLNSLALL
jgi:hypothetical protein